MKSAHATLLAFALVICSTAGSHAEDDSPACKDAARRIVSDTGAEFDRVEGVSATMWFTHPDGLISIDCSFGEPSASAYTKSPFPSDAWFVLAGRVAGILSPEAQGNFLSKIKACQKEALDADAGYKQFKMEKGSYACMANMADGSMFSITTQY